LQRMRSDYLSQEIRLQVLDDKQLNKAVAVAAVELERRLSKWGLILPRRTRSRTYKWPRTRTASVIKIEAHPREMMIVRAVARTWGAAQFGCSPDGSVFTADTDGWSWPPERGRRDTVTGLSKLLDDVADIFNSEARRNGAGGRFYERNGEFFDADDGSVFLEVGITRRAKFNRTTPVGKLMEKLAAGRRRGTATPPKSA
jgi:hypothetical protein